MKTTGWLLDCYVKTGSNHAVLWIKNESGEMLRVTDHFNPALYIEPRSIESGVNIHQLLDGATGVESVEWVEKQTLVSNSRKKKKRLLECRFETPHHFNMASRVLEKHPLVKDLYNVDLLPIQLYLYTKLGIEPTSRVEVEYDGDERIQGVSKLVSPDDPEDHQFSPPPFTSLYFDLHPTSTSLTPLPQRDPIQFLELISPDGKEKIQATLDGREDEIIERFIEIVRESNPDFLFAPEADNFTLPYLKTRADLLGIDLQLGREGTGTLSDRIKKFGLYLCPGRVCLDYSNYGYSFDDSGWGVGGLVERSQFACLPPSISGRWTANRVNDSRICFELIRRGHVIPKNRGAFEFIRSLSEIHERDRGGMIFSPKIKQVHYNVAELDFDSMYPNLIINRNISFETVTPDGVDVDRADAILPYVTKRALDRRLYFKRQRKNFPKGSQEWTWCEQRQAALKLVLVCVTPDTRVMMADGTEKKIRELEHTVDQCVVSFDPESRKVGPGSVTDYISLQSQSGFEAYRIDAESGRTITATGDHPFYTQRGWVNARDLREQDFVAVNPKAVMHEEPTEVLDESILVSEEDIARAAPSHSDVSMAVQRLKARKLLPLLTTDVRLPIIGRLMGHIFSDGALSLSYGQKRKCSKIYTRSDKMVCLSAGKQEDINELIEDIGRIGFEVPAGATQHRVSSGVIYNTNGSEHRFIQDGLSVVFTCAPLWLLLKSLGCPVGEKASVSEEVPEWIFRGPRIVRREFVAAYLGGDGSKPLWDKEGFAAPYFCLAKVLDLEENGLKFAWQIADMLKEFGVEIGTVQSHPERGRMRKDGKKTTAIIGRTRSSYDNLLRLYGEIGVRYSKTKETSANYVAEYLRIRKQVTDSNRNRVIKCNGATIAAPEKSKVVLDFLKENNDKAFYTTELTSALSRFGVTHQDIWFALGKLDKQGLLAKANERKYKVPVVVTLAGVNAQSILQQRLEEDFDPRYSFFVRWVRMATIGLEGTGLVWERIVKKEFAKDVTDVRDLKVSPNHSFIANGFVTHNCIYGTSGCCWNRFGNVLAFEEINRSAREVLIRAKDCAQKKGFEVIKGHTDSLFVKKPDATKAEYEELAREISELVGLPMSLDHHYKFLILLPQEGAGISDIKMEAMTRYFGLLWSGEVLARGIEIRRHDTPKFIKDFEAKLIQTLFDCSVAEEVRTKGYESSLELVTNEIDRVMTGELSKEDLIVSKILRKPLSEYNSLFPHVTAGLQLASHGKLLRAGDVIDYIIKDSGHVNPLCRTVPYELAEEKIAYDRGKYRDLLLDAAETILGTFGFSRDLYNYRRAESYDWLKQVYADRRKEALAEVELEEA